MQFELSTRELDAAMIATALRPLDPDARVALDVESGHLEVLSTASAAQVLGVLDAMGCVATPLSQDVHISGGSTCCGQRSEEHTSELQTLMRNQYAVLCL